MSLTTDLVQRGFTASDAEMLGDVPATNLVAAGTNQATALEIPASINRFTTVVAGVNEGARLKPILLIPQSQVVIRNDDTAGSDTLLVYPAVGERFNNQAIDIPISIPVDTARIFYKVTTTRWMTT
jgi:hypothetical protein